MAAGHQGQVALIGRTHVAQVIPHLELQQRDVRLEVAEAILNAVDVPALSVVIGGFDLVERVRRMQVRHLVKQTVDVGHHRLVVEHCQKERVLGQQVHDPHVGPRRAGRQKLARAHA